MTGVMAFGDSVLKGVISENNKYKICPDCFLNICAASFGINIENNAKFGNTVSRGAESIEKNLDKIKNSSSLKYILLEFGGNDCDFNWEKISENPQESHNPKTDIKLFSRIYTDILKKLKSTGKIPVLLSLPPIDSQNYFNTLSQNLNKDNILNWLGKKVQRIFDWHERYNLEVFNIALNNNVKIIDITSKFLEQPDYSLFLCPDGIHPNKEGHKIIAEAITGYVTKHNIIF